MTDPNEQKRRLLGVLDETVSSASSLQDRSREVLEQATRAGEVAGSFREVVQQAPNDNAVPAQTWRTMIQAWEAQRDQTRESLRALSSPTLSVTTTSATLTTTLSLAEFGPWLQGAGVELANRFHAVVHRPNETSDALEALETFDLNRSGALGRTPGNLISEGYAALSRPGASSPSPAAVLIPVREALNTVLAALIRRRPVQEPASKHTEKVLSLGRHCSLAGLPAGHFERLADDYAKLQDRLSSAKQANLTTVDVTARYDEALLFLKVLLQSLDPGKLRPA